MNVEDGNLSFGTSIDTSGFDKGVEHLNESVAQIGAQAEAQSAKINELLTNIPTVNIDVVTNAGQSLQTIEQGFDEIDRVVDTNKAAIRELEAEYKRLASEKNKAGQTGNETQYNALKQEQKAIKETIAARKQVIGEAGKQADALAQVENKLKQEAAAAQAAATQHTSLRQQIRALKEEMADMVANGIDEQSEAYKKLVNELGRLVDIQGDIQAQGTALANDEAQIAGVISGLSGLSGAFTAAQGAVGLFAGENEELNQIMLKVQSLMAITMGLQQVQQTLNKDSAFSLVTLNGLKRMWNKLTGESATEQAAETVATETNTAAQNANTASTVADTAAQTANNTSTTAGTVAQGANTVATKLQTAATVAGTVATKAMTWAMKGLKVALITTGIGALVVLLGELVNWISEVISSTDEADEQIEAMNSVMDEGAKVYGKASAEIQGYQQKINNFNGTKRQEKALVEELNQKYGSALGYYSSLSQWKEVLKSKGEAYCNMLLKEAEAQALLNKYTEAFTALQEVKNKKASDFGHWYTTDTGDQERKKEAETKAQEEADFWLAQYKKSMNDANNIAADFNIGGYTQPTKTQAKKEKKGKTDNFDPKQAALEQKKLIDEYAKNVKKYLSDAQQDIADMTLTSMTEGISKEISAASLKMQKALYSWDDKLKQLAELKKNTAKEVYMKGKGATEVKWSQTTDGQKTDKDWQDEVLKDEKVSTEYYRVRAKITENGEKEIQNIRQKYDDQLIEQFGTRNQKIELLERQWQEKLAFIPDQYFDEAVRQMDEEFAKLEADKLKESINWDTVFNDLDKMSVGYLANLKGKLQKFLKENKDLPIESIKEITTKMHDIDDAIDKESDTFGILLPTLEEYKREKQEAAEAQERLAEAVYRQAEAEMNLYDAKQQIADEIKADTGIIIDLKSITFSGKDDILKNVTDTKALERLNELFGKLARSENKASKAADDKIKAQSEANEAEDKANLTLKDRAQIAAEALGKLGDKLTEVSGLIDEIGLGDTGVGKAVNNAANGINSAAGAAADYASGNYIGAVTKGISAIKSFGSALGIGSGNAAETAKKIAELTASNDALKTAVEGLTKKMEESNGAKSISYYKKAYEAQERMNKNTAEILNAQMHYHAAHHSDASYWNLNSNSLSQVNTLLGTSLKNSWDSFSKLTAEQMNEIRTNLPDIWREMLSQGKYGSRGYHKQYWEDYADQAGKLEDLTKSINESLIGMSFDGLRDNFVSELMDMQADASKFSADFTKMMQQSLMNSLIANKYDEQLKKWYDKLGKALQEHGGELDTATIDSFKSEYDAMVNGMIAIRDQAAKITGYTGEDDTRQGTSKGIATASQDSIDENNARLTTIQGHTYTLVQGMNELNDTSNQILKHVAGIKDDTKDIRERVSNIGDDLHSVRNEIEDISTRGVKFKN